MFKVFIRRCFNIVSEYLGLTDIEFELMTFIWNQQSPVTFKEILYFCNDIKGWNWAKTTAHTYLTRLIRKKILGVTKTRGVRRTYFAIVSEKELAHNTILSIVNTSFNGSIKDLLLSMVPNSHLSLEDKKELHELLDQLVTTQDSS